MHTRTQFEAPRISGAGRKSAPGLSRYHSADKDPEPGETVAVTATVRVPECSFSHMHDAKYSLSAVLLSGNVLFPPYEKSEIW